MRKFCQILVAVLFSLMFSGMRVEAAGLPVDLNGDGKADLLWYNAASGQTSYWTMNGGAVTGAGVLLADPSWKIVGTADLNGDGKSDLIWYNAATGQTSYWLMNGGLLVGSGLLLTDPNWRVIATGDLNGDGKTDLIWYNASTGQTSYWLMDGASVAGTGLLLTDPVWTVVGTGDLNGDGKADLFWYNRVTGQTSVWLMNGGAALGYSLLLTDAAWKIAAIADLNGDGRVDLVWVNAATGQTAYWLMSGTAILTTGQLLLDANWRVVAAADLDGDGKSDLIWYDEATGQTSYWLMNGGALTSAAVLLADPYWTPSPASSASTSCFNRASLISGSTLDTETRATYPGVGTAVIDSHTAINGSVTFHGSAARQTTETVSFAPDPMLAQTQPASTATAVHYYSLDSGSASVKELGDTVTSASGTTMSTVSILNTPYVESRLSMLAGTSFDQAYMQTQTATVSGAPSSTTYAYVKNVRYAGVVVVTVPAGTFQACQFVETGTVAVNGGPPTSSGTSTTWVGMSTGVVLKTVTAPASGPSSTFELLSGAVNGVRISP